MKLDDLLAEFQGLDPEDALEMLIEHAEAPLPLSAGRAATPAPAECRIQECQTPVDLWVDVIGDRVSLEAYVPEKSPTVRGFVALLVAGLTGAARGDVLRMPDDLLPSLGLAETLGMTRQRGFRGIVARIKREVSRGAGLPQSVI